MLYLVMKELLQAILATDFTSFEKGEDLHHCRGNLYSNVS